MQQKPAAAGRGGRIGAGALVALLAAAAIGLVALIRRGLSAPPSPALFANFRDATSFDPASGAVRSVQTADLLVDGAALDEIWSPEHLERLARTYWRFLTRVTLGLIQVRYTETERSVVLLASPVKLLTFHAPEYEMDSARGLVRWRIASGLLVAMQGRDDRGYLQIEVRRSTGVRRDQVPLHVEVEVANFYPRIAFRLSRRLYDATQSRIHVMITRGFLRSLARLDLAESRVGRFAPAGGPRPPDAASSGRPRSP